MSYAYIDVKELAEFVKSELAKITCDICKKHIDITREPFVSTWGDGKNFHEHCLDAYREKCLKGLG